MLDKLGKVLELLDNTLIKSAVLYDVLKSLTENLTTGILDLFYNSAYAHSGLYSTVFPIVFDILLGAVWLSTECEKLFNKFLIFSKKPANAFFRKLKV